MVHDFIMQVTNEALLLILIVSLPPVVFSLIVGLVISLFQALTQIQEQTLSFVPKIIIVFGTLAIMAPTLGGALLQFSIRCFETFPKVVGQ